MVRSRGNRNRKQAFDKMPKPKRKPAAPRVYVRGRVCAFRVRVVFYICIFLFVFVYPLMCAYVRLCAQQGQPCPPSISPPCRRTFDSSTETGRQPPAVASASAGRVAARGNRARVPLPFAVRPVARSIRQRARVRRVTVRRCATSRPRSRGNRAPCRSRPRPASGLSGNRSTCAP